MNRRRRRGLKNMPCREFVEVITDYLEGTLPEPDRKRFDDHLAACGNCANYLEQVRTMLRLTGRLTEEQIPEQAREDLLQVFRNWQSA